MTATPAQAVNDIAKLLIGYWGVDNIKVPGIDGKLPDKANVPFAQMKLQHTFGNTASISGDAGTKLYDAGGNGTIELYFPLGNGVLDAYEMADAVQNLFRGVRTEHDVWFREIGLREVNYVSWYRLDVVFQFQYSQVA